MLKREATYFTPDLVLTNNKLSLTGKLWMENPPKYFEELFSITENKIRGDFAIDIQVDHLNSSSIKQIVMYFKLISSMKKKGVITSLKVEWKVDEDDIEHFGLVNDIAWITDIEIQIMKQSINTEK